MIEINDLEIREYTTKERIKYEIIPMIIFTILVVSMATIYILYEHDKNEHKKVTSGEKYRSDSIVIKEEKER